MRRESEVYTSPTQHEDLKKRCENQGTTVEACYDKLNRWKISKGIIGGRNDYKAITEWVISAVLDEKKTNAPSRGESSTMEACINWKLSLQNDPKYRKAILDGKVYVSDEYVEFSVRGNSPERVYLKDPGFIETTKNYLRKL